jgi:hypothetical protein
MMSNKKLLFVITEDWFFVSHFLERAEAAVKDGFEVAVATRVSKTYCAKKASTYTQSTFHAEV